MSQTLKWGPKSSRNPEQGIFTGIEFDTMHRMGKIRDGELIEMLPGYYTGKDALFTRRFWDAEITNPYGGVFLDFSGSDDIFPKNENDPFWAGMGYPSKFNGEWLLQYGGAYGGKGGLMVGEGTTKIIGDPATRIRISGDTAGTAYGNITGILANWPGGKLWLENVDVDRNDDGVRGNFAWYAERNCNFELNGSGDGQSHAKYIDAMVAVVDGGNSFDTRVGHNGKWETGLLVKRNHRNRNTVPKVGPSYDDDINGGMVFVIGGEMADNAGDSNPFHMMYFNTARRPWGPHFFGLFGVKQIAQVIKAGDYVAIDNRVNDYSNPATYDYHHAALLLNADGTPLGMPVDVLIDGCDAQYAPGKISYRQKNWNVNNPGVRHLNDISSSNRLIATDDPAAAQDVTRVDLNKIASVNKIGAMLAAYGLDKPYTPEFMDALCGETIAARSQWTYPVGAVTPTPAPTPDPAPAPQPDPEPAPAPEPPPPTPEETIAMLQEKLDAATAALQALQAQAQAEVNAATNAAADALARAVAAETANVALKEKLAQIAQLAA